MEKIAHIKDANTPLKTVTIIATDLLQLGPYNTETSTRSFKELFSEKYACIYPSKEKEIEVVLDESHYKLNVISNSNKIGLKNTVLVDIVAYEHWFKKPITFNYITLNTYNLEALKSELKQISTK